MNPKINQSTQLTLALIILTCALFTILGCNSATPSPAPGGATAPPPPAGQPTGAAPSGEATAAVVPAPTAVASAVLSTAVPTTTTTTLPVKVLKEMNLRAGPGTDYAVAGSLKAGEEVEAVGRNDDGSWLLVKTKDGTEAWISSSADLVEVGDTTALAVVLASPPPPPSYDAGNPMVNQVLNQIPLVIYHASSHTCASPGGINKLSGVAEGNVIGPHSGDFVLNSKDNVLFKKVGGSLRLIKENPVARFEGDAESLSFDRAMQLFANGSIVWTGHFGDWPARGVTGCDPAVKP